MPANAVAFSLDGGTRTLVFAQPDQNGPTGEQYDAQQGVRTIALSSGGFAVFYGLDAPTELDTYAVFYDADGNSAGSPVLVLARTGRFNGAGNVSDDPINVVALPGGGFAIAYVTHPASGGSAVQVGLFTAAGVQTQAIPVPFTAADVPGLFVAPDETLYAQDGENDNVYAIVGNTPGDFTLDATADTASETLTGTSASRNYILAGSGSGATTIAGGTGANYVVGGASPDLITGGAANDTLIAGTGGGTLNGGGGADLLRFTGSANATVIAPSGAATLQGGTGANLIELGASTALANTLGTDTIIGSSAAATINAGGAALYFGAGGAAIFNILSASATLVGGGAETVKAGASSALVFGGAGPLTFNAGTVAGAGASTIISGAGGGTITGGTTGLLYFGTGPTTYIAGAAVDTILGFTGTLTATGGSSGTLFFTGTGGANNVSTGSGSSTIIGFGTGDTLTATGSGTDIIAASGASETINGANSAGANTYFAFGANDSVIGGAGTTAIESGLGNHTLVAGSGSTLFEILAGTLNRTITIGNFNATQDFVQLQGYGAGAGAAALQTASVTGGSEVLTLNDGTKLTFTGVTGLTAGSFV